MSIRIMCEAASRSLDFPYCFIKRSIIDSDFLEAFRCREISDLQKDWFSKVHFHEFKVRTGLEQSSSGSEKTYHLINELSCFVTTM